MFQQTVKRNFTTGFVGDIVRDGPRRGKVGRFVPYSGTASGNKITEVGNVISRAFGYSGDLGLLGTAPNQTDALDAYTIVAGGSDFFGILAHRKHYTLQGTQAGGTLAASVSLPMGSEGECFDMVTGVVVQLFNVGGTAMNVLYGAGVAYINADADATKLAALQAGAGYQIPSGGLFAIPKGTDTTNLDGVATIIPNARVQESVTIPASVAGTPGTALTIVQLTQ